MPDGARYDLGQALALEAEAIGVPGQRRFRIRITTAEATASLWCEKEQVNALSTAVEQVIARYRRAAERRIAAPELEPFPAQPTHDFQIGSLALGYDEDADALAIYVTDVAADDDTPTLRVAFTRDLGRRFAAQAAATVHAGRPLCPLCKAPLEPEGHLCPPANGHSEDPLAWIDPLDF